MNFEEIKNQVLKLEPEERLALSEVLFQSVGVAPPPCVTAAEAEERLDAYLRGEVSGSSMDEVFQRLENEVIVRK